MPADWHHPKNEFGQYVALFDGKDYKPRVREWDEGDGARPDADNYMPRWTDAERTHYIMYEITSEGTPITPNFATLEELARWLKYSNSSAFGDDRASYQGWLRVASGGFAPSRVFTPQTGMVSGVDAF